MIGNKNKTQSAGDDSVNVQADTINIQTGIDYPKARQIAIDVYHANAMQITQEANEVALQRLQEFVGNYLDKLFERSPSAVQSMKDPGMQYSLMEAQKAYVRTGDKDLEGLLIDILVERAGNNERNLHQIVLDESLAVAPKLTAEHMDALTVNFLLTKTFDRTMNSLDSLKTYLERIIYPFLDTLRRDTLCYSHLEYVRCASIVDKQLEINFFEQYPNLFCKGFTEEEFNKGSPHKIEKYKSLLIPHTLDKNKLQYDAFAVGKYSRDETDIKDSPQIKRGILEDYHHKRRLMKQELQPFLRKVSPGANRLIELWYGSDLSKIRLTPVGIAIAQANVRRRLGVRLDLSNWITD